MTPSGSLNLRSKFPLRSSPRSKKNFPPARLDARLRLGQIVDLEAEMIGADGVPGVVEVMPLPCH